MVSESGPRGRRGGAAGAPADWGRLGGAAPGFVLVSQEWTADEPRLM
jgi:hypothetical protein